MIDINLWVVYYKTRYGNDFRIFSSEESAREQVLDFLIDADVPNAVTEWQYGYEWHLPNQEYIFLTREPVLE